MPIKTNWYIITGGPSSGKTKVLEQLSFLGYRTIPEVARIIIDVERSNGKTTTEIRKNEGAFQKKVLQMKIELENRLIKNECIFLERAIPDSIVYDIIAKINPSKSIAASKKRTYAGILLLDQLPFEYDYARTENNKTAEQIAKLLKKIYTDLGYTIIKVPVMPIDKRAQFILKKIKSFSQSSL